MLEAVQVVVVYGMLCSQCTESVSVDDATNLVATIEVCASIQTGKLPSGSLTVTRLLVECYMACARGGLK